MMPTVADAVQRKADKAMERIYKELAGLASHDEQLVYLHWLKRQIINRVQYVKDKRRDAIAHRNPLKHPKVPRLKRGPRRNKPVAA